MSDSAADPARGVRPGSFLGLLSLADPAEARAVLRGMPGQAIADGIARARWPLPVAVTDFVVGALRTGIAVDGHPLPSETGAPEPDRAPAIALAKRLAARNRVASQEDDALRRALLRLADPDVDAELFALGAQSVPWWIRVAILRSRRGPDGRAIVPVALKQRLLELAVAIVKRRGPGAVRPGINEVRFPLPSLLVHADDPDLVRAGLMLIDWNPFQTGGEPWEPDDPRAQWWVRLRGLVAEAVVRSGDVVEPLSDDHAEAAQRLRDYVVEGWRNLEYGPYARAADSPDWDERGSGSTRFGMAWDLALERARLGGGAWCVGLDEAAYRDDCPPDVRERLMELYPRAVLSVARPTVGDLLRANAVLTAKSAVTATGPDRSGAVAAASESGNASAAPEPMPEPMNASPLRREKVLRAMAIRGLSCGSLDPADAVSYVEPAAVVVSLAVPNVRRRAEAGAPDHDVRGRIALQAALVAQARQWLGTDPDLWCALIAHVATWPGSFGSLSRRIAEKGPDLPCPDRRAPRWPHGIDAAAVMLVCAPEGIAEHFVALGHRGVLTRILDRGPLNRVVVEHAVGTNATRAMRLALARNTATPLKALWHLVHRDDIDPAVLGAAYLHPAADHHLRTQIIARSEAAVAIDPRLTHRLARASSVEMLAPLLASRDPILVYSALHKINADVTPQLRALAYATLADQAGPEVVWTLDAERTGSAIHASRAVRASMASGTAAPLVAAVDVTALPELALPKPPLPEIRDEDFPRNATTWPDAKAHWEKLHGYPDRWRALATLTADEPDAPARDLVDRAAAARGGDPL